VPFLLSAEALYATALSEEKESQFMLDGMLSAARAGHPDAQLYIAKELSSHNRHSRAEFWYGHAARGGNYEAAFELSKIADRPEVQGLPPNAWFDLAVHTGMTAGDTWSALAMIRTAPAESGLTDKIVNFYDLNISQKETLDEDDIAFCLLTTEILFKGDNIDFGLKVSDQLESAISNTRDHAALMQLYYEHALDSLSPEDRGNVLRSMAFSANELSAQLKLKEAFLLGSDYYGIEINKEAYFDILSSLAHKNDDLESTAAYVATIDKVEDRYSFLIKIMSKGIGDSEIKREISENKDYSSLLIVDTKTHEWLSHINTDSNHTAQLQFFIGRRYLSGEPIRDDSLAFQFINAAHRNNKGEVPEITYQKAYCIDKGIGTEMDEVEAITLYQEAAEAGHVEAQYHLGMRLINFSGSKPMEDMGMAWLEKASENGSIAAGATLFRLEKGRKALAEEIALEEKVAQPQTA